MTDSTAAGLLPRHMALNPTPLIQGGVSVRCIRSARKLLSKVISGFCRGQLEGDDARTLAYLLSTYSTMTKDHLLEERLNDLESKLAAMERGKGRTKQ